MIRDEVIRLAQEADLWLTSDERIAAVERFAALVAAKTIEQAQSVVHDMNPRIQTMLEEVYMQGALAGATAEREACLNCYSPDDTATDWADKIRARGGT